MTLLQLYELFHGGDNHAFCSAVLDYGLEHFERDTKEELREGVLTAGERGQMLAMVKAPGDLRTASHGFINDVETVRLPANLYKAMLHRLRDTASRLDDLAIDLDGEEESTLALIRLQLHEFLEVVE